MAFHIMKNTSFLEHIPERYRAYAAVESTRGTILQKLFGSGADSVRVVPSEGAEHLLLRVVVPAWKGGKGDAWDRLQQCYEKVLRTAADRKCDAIVLPLLAAEHPEFPASIDYKIAVETIRLFQETNRMDVFLVVLREHTASGASLDRKVKSFLEANFLFQEPRWSSRPFESTENRFDTFAPPPMASVGEPSPMGMDASADFDLDWEEIEEALSLGKQAPSCQESLRIEEDEDDWIEEEENLLPMPMGRSMKKAAPAPKSSRKARTSERSFGRRPDIPGLDRLDAGFSETLLSLIDKTGKKDSEIYNKANVSRQHFSKIRNNPDYKPTKATALAFAIALELNLAQTEDLIGRAGYKLTRSSTFDVIIMYFIQEGHYNMFDINETLYEYDQSLLGA